MGNYNHDRTDEMVKVVYDTFGPTKFCWGTEFIKAALIGQRIGVGIGNRHPRRAQAKIGLVDVDIARQDDPLLLVQQVDPVVSFHDCFVSDG